MHPPSPLHFQAWLLAGRHPMYNNHLHNLGSRNSCCVPMEPGSMHTPTTCILPHHPPIQTTQWRSLVTSPCRRMKRYHHRGSGSCLRNLAEKAAWLPYSSACLYYCLSLAPLHWWCYGKITNRPCPLNKPGPCFSATITISINRTITMPTICGHPTHNIHVRPTTSSPAAMPIPNTTTLPLTPSRWDPR